MAWTDVIGHDVAKRILQSHLASGRVPNAYLLVGPDGIGKRRLALEMAKALNCAAPARPCDACRSCSQISRGTNPDVHQIIPGGASEQIKIEQIRTLIGRVALRPFSAAYQVAILDGADRLTEEAGNSLLKALEEPSATTKFLLTTSQVSACLPTIVSRCQIVRCRPLPPPVVEQLLENQGIEMAAARSVARLSGGSMSRAQELAGRWDGYRQLLDRLSTAGVAAWIEAPGADTRQDVARLLEGMVAWLRDVIVASAGGDVPLAHADRGDAIQALARGTDVDRCLDTAEELVRLRGSIEQFVNPRLVAALAREHWLALAGGER
jgi:DNA polymerase-3 subunit delta'